MKKTKPRFPNLLDRLYPPEQRRRSAAMAVLLGALATVYFLLPPPALESLRDEEGISLVSSSPTANQPAPLHGPLEKSAIESSFETIDLTLRPGDTLQGTLRKYGLTPASANDLIKQLQSFYDPKKMRAGDTFRLLLDGQNRIQGLEHSANGAMPEGSDTRKYGTTAITFYRSEE